MRLFRPRWLWADWFRLGLSLSVGLVLIAALVGWQFVKPAEWGSGFKTVVVQDGASAKQISRQLYEAGLISSTFWFEVWLWLTGNETKIQGGFYSFPANINIINLTRLLTGNLVSQEVTVRLQEGWTIKEMAAELAKHQLFTVDDFISTATSPTQTQVIAGRIEGEILESWPGGSLEGYLFPDTYRFYRQSTPQEIIIKMINNLDTKLPVSWREVIKDRGYSIHQLLTLASIVEKEVPGAADRKMVADIFWKRLRANVGLQADSTINYFTGRNVPSVSSDDLAIDSPYNTYKYRGLPPGPIANPSLSAIEAVVFPQHNDYWYFLTTPQGQVIYSKTFEEHKQAKAKYLR